MQTQRQRFESFFKLPGTRYREYESTLLAVADAFDESEKTDNLPAERLQVIVNAVSSPRAYVWQSCCSMLAAASERWLEAGEAILQMSRNPKAQVRFNAICSLGRGTPPQIMNEVLSVGLKDRSAQVRWKAADRAESLDQRQLIPEVTAALTAEKNDNARRSIEFALRFLRDGYVVRLQANGSYSVSARLGKGGGGSIKDVTADEFRTKGIKAIVAEMQDRHDATATAG